MTDGIASLDDAVNGLESLTKSTPKKKGDAKAKAKAETKKRRKA